MVVAGQLARKMEVSITASGLQNICIKGTELPRCKLCKGTHGERVVIPVKFMEVERIPYQHPLKSLHFLRFRFIWGVQYSKVLVYLIEKYHLRW